MNLFSKLFFFLTLMTTQLVLSQTSEILEISKKDIFLVSCNHPIITKANQNGLISLKLREIPSFIFLDFKCKIQDKRENIKIKRFKGFTSSIKNSFCIFRVLF